MRCLATLLALFALTLPAAAQDSDGDGVPSSLEETGYRWNVGPDVFEACTPDVDDPCFVTDPLSWSSDGDPYGDGQEASGVNMDNAVGRPYNSPIVAAYPVIEVALDAYTFTSNATITDSDGGELTSGNEVSYGVETTASASVTVGVEASYPGGVSGSAEATASFSETVSYSSTQTSGSAINWETATTNQLNDAGTLALSLSIGNTGGAAARNVRPRFNVYIGDDLVATVLPGVDDAIQTLDPGSVSEPFIPDGADEVGLTFAQLQALQFGAPVTVEVVEIFADIRRWTTETSNWGCGTQGDETCSWSNFQSQILPRTLRLLVDFGYTGDPDADIPFQFRDNPFEFRIYTGSPNSTPEITLRDALRTVEFTLEEAGDDLVIEGRPYPSTWLLTAQADEDGFSPILQAWEDAGEPDDLLDVVMPTDATLLMASPDPTGAGPVISAASFTEDLLGVRASATPKGSIPVVAAEARIVQYGGAERVVPMMRSADGTFWTTEGAASSPFLEPARAQSSFVVFTDRSGATRRTESALGLPIFPAQSCDEVPPNDRDRRPNPVGSGFDTVLFADGDLDAPLEAYCEGDTERYWVPKETGVSLNGLYGAVWINPREAVVVGNETILRSADGGRTWSAVEVEGLGAVLWDLDRAPDTGTLVAVGGSDASVILRSTDDGQTWAFATPSFSGTTLAVGYAGNGKWYAVGENGVKISTNDGQTWTDDPNAPENTGAFVSVAFRDAQTGILLNEGAGTGGTGRTWRTTDGGQSWTNVFTATGVTDVAYGGDGAWYVTQDIGTPRRVLRSLQNGDPDTWEVLDLPGSVSPRSVSFATPEIGYVAGNAGVFRTENAGGTWTLEPRLDSDDLLRAVAVYDTNRSLAAGIFGMVKLTTSGGGNPTLAPVASEQDPGSAPAAFSLDSAFPNPFRGQATVDFTLGEPGNVSLEVYDMLGRRVARLVNEPKPAGTHKAPLDGRGLASGVYVVRLLVGDRAETRRITLIR